MKIKIAYGPGERLQANMTLAALQKLLPQAGVKRSERHPPFAHIYLETQRTR